MNENEKNTKNSFDIPDYPQNFNCEPVDSSPSQTLAIISFISSILGMVCCIGFIGGIFSIAAIVTGVISLHKKETRGFAVCGIIIGAADLIISTVITVIKLVTYSAAISQQLPGITNWLDVILHSI